MQAPVRHLVFVPAQPVGLFSACSCRVGSTDPNRATSRTWSVSSPERAVSLQTVWCGPSLHDGSWTILVSRQAGLASQVVVGDKLNGATLRSNTFTARTILESTSHCTHARTHARARTRRGCATSSRSPKRICTLQTSPVHVIQLAVPTCTACLTETYVRVRLSAN
jgi:hypothetical protein